MCGIIGIQCNGHFSRDAFVRMLKDSADRGQDSTGVAGVTLEGEVFFHRALGDVENWLKTVPTDFWDTFDKALFILGVTRAQPVPEGDSIRVENRQPILYGDWLGVHNGTIGNDRELKAQYGFQVKSQIDSEVALALLNHKFNGSIESIQDWASELSGGMTIIAVNVKTRDWVVIKNFKPLCFAYADDGVVVWASERKTLEIGGFGDIRWVPPYTGFLNVTFRHFDIDTLHETFVPVADEDKAIVVASGGIDSSTAAYVAKKLHDKEVTLLHFDYGQIAREREWEAVCAVSMALECSKMQVDISWLGRLADTPLVSSEVELPLGIKSVETTGCWVPARNLIMLSIAAGICESLGIGCIYSGFNLSESGVYSDNDVEFLKVFNLVLNYGTLRRPKLILALERLMKPEIIKLGDYLGTPYYRTWSCDLGGDKPCGQCGCCWMRQFAFKRAQIEDGQEYLSQPLEYPPWYGAKTSEVAPLEDILRRVQQRGLEDLIKI